MPAEAQLHIACLVQLRRWIGFCFGFWGFGVLFSLSFVGFCVLFRLFVHVFLGLHYLLFCFLMLCALYFVHCFFVGWLGFGWFGLFCWFVGIHEMLECLFC